MKIIIIAVALWILAFIYWVLEARNQRKRFHKNQKERQHKWIKQYRNNIPQGIAVAIRWRKREENISVKDNYSSSTINSIPSGNDVFIRGGNGALVRANKKYTPKRDKYQRWKRR